MSELNTPLEEDGHSDPEEFDQNVNIVSEWLTKFKSNSLSESDFHNYWKIWVPYLLKPKAQGNSRELSFNKQNVQKMLFDTLEEFICNGDSTTLHGLFEQNFPPSVCGQLFKIGEPIYTCQECEVDNTCALCVDCFKRSPHINHKYKMRNSYKGGCCDCGNVEAWRRDAYCQIHKLGLEKKHIYSNFFTSDMLKRAHFVFQYVLCYARESLTLEHFPMEMDSDELEDGLHSICRKKEDSFCTVIYNDESNTFDQVITTIIRILKCTYKKASEYTTSIDRDGRAIVRCASFIKCKELKEKIERYIARLSGNPLKIVIIHSYVIAHQIYALRLLAWMRHLLKYSERLRAVFSNIVLASTTTEECIIESILLKDTVFWKLARLQWQKLFIVGMFVEYENKKEFSKVFIRNYGAIMNDFIKNDYNYSYSAASLGIQIFTAPRLVHYLLAHHNILYQLFDTFWSKCIPNKNSQGQLEFDYNNIIKTFKFKRALHILGDLRYVLCFITETQIINNPTFRISFCHAISVVIDILNCMQNMNTVTRTITHITEYDPEWETAFNLQLKMRPLLTKILLLCGSDNITLKDVYGMTLMKVLENPIFDDRTPTVVKELLDYKVNCIDYDVSIEPVSIHLPLSRFLAGLYLYFDRYGLSFEHLELQTSKLSPEQIIEPVLRSQVLISQVNTGMWKRNGFSLCNQIQFYHDSKYRMEMLDKDIVTLQMGATLIENNAFLIHVLNKFNLINWAQPDFELTLLHVTEDEDDIRQTTSLVAEFLTLIITIVGERFNPDVGKVTLYDYIKKEVIQQLCVEPKLHSQLKNALLYINDDAECLKRVIKEVADFKKIRGNSVYELKPIYYDDYNIYFYHYSKEEMSKSELEQRKRKKMVGELDCCPPPSLPLFNDAFAKIANLLQCDVMLYIMKLILNRTLNLGCKYFSESQLHKVLHLIGYALHEEEKQKDPSFKFIERSKSYAIEIILDKLKSSPRVEASKDLITWILQKFRDVGGPKQYPVTTNVVEDMEDVESDYIELEKQKRAKKADDRRVAVMAQMTQMQTKFMEENTTLFENVPTYSGSHHYGMDILYNINKVSVALGPYQTTHSTFDNKYVCILCQEEQVVTHESEAMVLTAFVQISTVLCQWRDNSDKDNDPYYIPENFGPSPHISTCGHVMHDKCWKKQYDIILANENKRRSISFNVEKNEYLCPLCEGLCNTAIPLLPHISSFKEPKNKTFENWLEELNMSINQSKVVEPMTAITSTSEPVVAQQTTSTESVDPEQNRTSVGREISLEAASLVAGNSMTQVIELRENNELQQDEEVLLTPSNQLGTNDNVIQIPIDKSSQKTMPKVSKSKNNEISTSLVDAIFKFAYCIFSKAIDTIQPSPDNSKMPLLTWKACAYTIHSTEVILRHKNKPLFGELSCRQKDCLEALVRVSVILSSTWKNKLEINVHALRILLLAINNDGDNSIGILDWDAFGMLVSLTMTLPSLYYTVVPASAPRGNMFDFHILFLMFITHIVQIILTINIKENSEDMLEMDPEDAVVTFCLIRLVYKLRGINIKNTVVVWRLIERCAVPFLRCCSLFYHFLTGVPPSSILTEVNGDTYHNMCCYLGLPTTCKTLLDNPYVEALINKWAENEKLIKIRKGEKIIFKNWTHINELVQLPDDYSELINTVSAFTCPNSNHEDQSNPTLCLVCGAILCSINYCCHTSIGRGKIVGTCSGHAYSCGCGVGVFLGVRECKFFILATLSKGIYISSPYLDEHDETDRGLKRGNPLYLCKDQYRKLQILWLDHSLYEEISRYTLTTQGGITTGWRQL